jgi:hypothetical protein
MSLLRALTAPARAWRYLTKASGGDFEARYEAMTPAEKEAYKWQSMRRNGLFLTFAKLDRKPQKREDDKPR